MKEPLDILNHLTQAVVVVDDGLRVTFLNHAAEALFAQSVERCIDQPIERLFVDPSSPPSAMLAALAEAQPFTKREAELNVNNHVIHADYSVALLGDDHLVIEVNPLDRLQRINRDDQQISLQRTSQELIRGMAHEIKNPLGGIRGAAQLLDRELQLPEHHEYTQVIIDEADRLRNLVDRMLGPSERPTLEPINIHQVLQRVVQLVDAEEPQRIRFVRDYDPSLPEFKGDFSKLVQAMLNILRNASEAMAETTDPEIRLTTRAVRQFTIGHVRHRLVAEIRVTDNGKGISQEIAGRIFYPMISGRPDGTGLGLAITQQIIAQHNGIIEYASTPGETQFSIFLPLEQTNG